MHSTVPKQLSDIRQAASTGDLAIHHHHELSPTVKMAVSALRAEAFFLNTRKVLSVDKVKQLIKDCVMIC